MFTGFTYWSEVGESKLNEDNHQWVHALPIGEYNHPVKGKLSFTPDRIKRFAESIKNRIRGIDLDVDYDHKMDPAKGAQASGWIKDADVRPNGLWVLVEWTKDAAQAINDKKYRYFSSEFLDEWEDPKGNKYTDVMSGGALTNRPFVKDLVPVNLNEIMQEDTMDRKKLIELLKLSDDATDQQIEEAITKLSEGTSEDTGIDLSKAEVKVSEEGKVIIKVDDKEQSFDVELPKSKEDDKEDDKELAKLAETNPAIATILSERQKDRERIQNLENAHRLSEVSTQLSDIGKDHGKVLPPVVQDKFKALMVQLPAQLSDKVHDGLVELIKVGVVELGERTPGGTDPNSLRSKNGDAVETFLSEVEKLKKEDKELTTRDAYEQIRLNDPELHARYQDAIAEGYTLTE